MLRRSLCGLDLRSMMKMYFIGTRMSLKVLSPESEVRAKREHIRTKPASQRSCKWVFPAGMPAGWSLTETCPAAFPAEQLSF